jgi:hypothetical protein
MPTGCAVVGSMFSRSFACHPSHDARVSIQAMRRERGGHTLARPITASVFTTRPLPLPASSHLVSSTLALPERVETSSDKQILFNPVHIRMR